MASPYDSGPEDFPICGSQCLAHLGHWQGHDKKPYPEELLDHKLFKCRKGIWLVVPGVKECS